MSPEVVQADLAKRFAHHVPALSTAQGQKQCYIYKMHRDKCLELALQIAQFTPAGREQSLALTKLEEVMFWANAGVARNPEKIT